MRSPLFLLHAWIVFTLIFTVNGSGGNALLQSMTEKDANAASAIVAFTPNAADPTSQDPTLEVGSKAPIEMFHRSRSRLRLNAADSVAFARVDLNADFLQTSRRAGHASPVRELLLAAFSPLSVRLLI